VSVIVLWFGGSFVKLGFNVGLFGFANVPQRGIIVIQAV